VVCERRAVEAGKKSLSCRSISIAVGKYWLRAALRFLIAIPKTLAQGLNLAAQAQAQGQAPFQSHLNDPEAPPDLPLLPLGQDPIYSRNSQEYADLLASPNNFPPPRPAPSAETLLETPLSILDPIPTEQCLGNHESAFYSVQTVSNDQVWCIR
jgi:hypothetical protein